MLTLLFYLLLPRSSRYCYINTSFVRTSWACVSEQLSLVLFIERYVDSLIDNVFSNRKRLGSCMYPIPACKCGYWSLESAHTHAALYVKLICTCNTVPSIQAMRLSNFARKNTTTGQIVNLMAIDAQRFMDLMMYFHMIWSAPLQIVLAVFFLWQTMGPAVLAGVGVMILLIPVNGVLAVVTRKLQVNFMALCPLVSRRIGLVCFHRSSKWCWRTNVLKSSMKFSVASRYVVVVSNVCVVTVSGMDTCCPAMDLSVRCNYLYDSRAHCCYLVIWLLFMVSNNLLYVVEFKKCATPLWLQL